MGARARADRADAISKSALRLGASHDILRAIVDLGRVFAAAAQLRYESASRLVYQVVRAGRAARAALLLSDDPRKTGF